MDITNLPFLKKLKVKDFEKKDSEVNTIVEANIVTDVETNFKIPIGTFIVKAFHVLYEIKTMLKKYDNQKVCLAIVDEETEEILSKFSIKENE